MKQCDRCRRWFHEGDSPVCDPCWEEMGQMTFWHDDDDDEPLTPIEGRILQGKRLTENLSHDVDPIAERRAAEDDWEDRHPIDSIFDRDSEINGGGRW